jgi:hypothetical protein
LSSSSPRRRSPSPCCSHRRERSVELLDRALVLAPTDTRVILDAIHIFEITGERNKAPEVAARAIELGLREQIQAVDDLEELILDRRYKQMITES